MKKITWEVIRDSFKKRYPKKHKEVIYWRPHQYGTIKLYFKDGRTGTYNYDERKLVLGSETWKHE